MIIAYLFRLRSSSLTHPFNQASHKYPVRSGPEKIIYCGLFSGSEITVKNTNQMHLQINSLYRGGLIIHCKTGTKICELDLAKDIGEK